MSRKLCMGCMTEYDTRQCAVCPHCGAANSGIPKDASHLKPGTQLKQGRYIVGLSMDSGKYNITYIGCDLQTRQKIVVKEYFPRECCSRQKGSNQIEMKRGLASEIFKQGYEEFSRDGQDMLLAKIPGMVRMREVFAENGTVYEVMDYLDGSTLEESLKGQKMSMDEVLSIMLPVIETVYRLHKKELFHLNIHPCNIFLLSTGEVFLMDIGRWRCNLEKQSKETTVNDYQAPELRIRDVHINAGADIYSLCAIMNQILRQEKKKTETYESRYNSMLNGLEPDALRRTASIEQLFDELISVRRIQRVPAEENKVSLKERYLKESVTALEDRDSFIKKSGRKNILFFAIPCLLIVVAAIGIFTIKSKRSASENSVAIVKNDGKTAPNIIGSDVNTAKKELREEGINLNITNSEEVSDEEKVNKIISQIPEKGKNLDDSKTINITVGTTKTTIAKELGSEKIYGHPYNEKNENKLADVFNTYLISEESYIIPGYLIRIDQGDQEKHEKLGIDEKILQYKPITFVKSIGQKNLKTGQKTERKVEDIKGENPMDSNIAAWAEKYHFYYGISDKEKYSVYPTSKGEVAAIEINRAGNKIKVKDETAIETGDEVVLILSKGPKKAKLKSNYWTGKTKNQVTEYLKKYHIKTEFIEEKYSDSVKKGIIIGESSIDSPYKSADIDVSQKNKDGSKAQYYEGDTINLIVSKGEKPVVTEYKQPSTSGGSSSSDGSSRKSSGGSKRKNSGSSSNKKTNQSKPNPGPGLD